ncbi:hypothetical protein B0H14DRAFT_2667925 [Mycena olivaceomarginata]|nr:hypothetical protein B0H14DRAFT_2667925 [Mycena olivaceomarginata]
MPSPRCSHPAARLSRPSPAPDAVPPARVANADSRAPDMLRDCYATAVMSKSPHLPATAFPAPDYDHPRYATPVRTPYTTWTVDPMRSVDVGVPRRPRRPRRLLSPRPSSASSAIDAYPYHAHHTQSLACTAPPAPVPPRARPSPRLLPCHELLPLPLEGSACHAPTRRAPPTCCVTAAAAIFRRARPLRLLHARLPPSVRSRSGYHHLMGVPPPTACPATVTAVPDCTCHCCPFPGAHTLFSEVAMHDRGPNPTRLPLTFLVPAAAVYNRLPAFVAHPL